MKHFAVCKYEPVFERVVKKEYWLSNRVGELLYEKRETFYYFRLSNSNYDLCKKELPGCLKTMYRIMRIRRHRVGQMELFMKVRSKKKVKKEHYDKVYC